MPAAEAGSAAPFLVLAAPDELPAERRIWGTGGWLPPEAREALDWLTLARLLGWGVAVRWLGGAAGEAATADPPRPAVRWLVVACNPDDLGQDVVGELAAFLAGNAGLVVARAGRAGEPLAGLAGAARCPERIAGRTLRWIGPPPVQEWRCRGDAIEGTALALAPGAEVWAELDGAPLIAARRVGRGMIATLGFHPSGGRDRAGAATALLRHLLVCGAQGPVIWLDLSGCLFLRMDDPGGAQNVHSRSYAYSKLDGATWAAIGRSLARRRARMSVAYVAGWVDDGDAERGSLTIDDRPVERVPGCVHPSSRVRYRSHGGGALQDYVAEFRAIRALQAAGAVGVELHGHTHMHPDLRAWARAPDRYDAVRWYRELGPDAEPVLARLPAAHHPLALGAAAIERDFGVAPTTLICPGDEFTAPALERALDLGLRLVGSYYLALRNGRRFCWAQHVCAPYLDRPDAAWFDSELPVVGYFHDRDLALDGVAWLDAWLDRWRAAGARRLLDFRELAAALSCRLRHDRQTDALTAVMGRESDAPAPVRPVRLGLWLPPGMRWPRDLAVETPWRSLSVPIRRTAAGMGLATIPADAARHGPS